MDLRFDELADWVVLTDRGWTTLASGQARVLLTPLVVASAIDPREVLEEDVPVGTTCEWLAVSEHVTRTGWPMTLVALRVNAGDQVLEYRLGAVFKFLSYVAVAAARFATAEAYEQNRPALLELFASVRPDLASTELACVEDWYLDRAV